MLLLNNHPADEVKGIYSRVLSRKGAPPRYDQTRVQLNELMRIGGKEARSRCKRVNGRTHGSARHGPHPVEAPWGV